MDSTPDNNSQQLLDENGQPLSKQALKKLQKLEKFNAKQAKQNAAPTGSKSTKSNAPAPPAATKDVSAEWVNPTPPGEKKDMTLPMQDAYHPKQVEAAWYDWWEGRGHFKEQLDAQGKPLAKGTYVVPIPPPNVTGSLHLGHALTNAIQDALIRWHRMRGFTTLYVPGCDHAGISTQAVVEKRLWKEQQLTRHDLGRGPFLERVWAWKQTYGDRIYKQLRRLGSSYDWSRACFTMDPKCVKAVKEAFVRLHEEGVIYRDMRLVNWSCYLNTALSNLEVEMRELTGRTLLPVPGHPPTAKYEFGVIHSFAYPIEASDEKIVVATTRIETMLGDTAIAVHPTDERYKNVVGKYVIHPFNGRRIPIVADEMVDKEFGTGAVKITPAHDPNDFQVGKRHNLPFINILNDNGSINENGAQFQGMMRFEARVFVLKALKEKGLFVETKNNPMSIPICTRSGDIIEPMLKPQWYVNCQEMAKDALQAVEDQRLVIVPKTSEKEWATWLNNIQDWCISRQLWWGHSIPAYFVLIEDQENDRLDNNYWVSGRTEEEALQKAYDRFPKISKDKIKLEQDPDVLDTWFSSALWPFAIFGWPDKTTDLEFYYPNSLLETGWDILFFWVARMVFFGMKLTGKVPFKYVFCHAMVRDAHGRKMSKSLGNVIDPIDVIQGVTLEELHKQLESGNLDPKEIEKAKAGQKQDFPKGIPECGTDALRFALCAYTAYNRDINLDILRVEGYRKFCNKIWNATRFALMKLGDDFVPKPHLPRASELHSLAEKWLMYRLNQAIADVFTSMTEFNFVNATTAIHKFWLYELCDVYIEYAKPIVDGDSNEGVKLSVRNTLYTALDYALRLVHPFMPFISEELFQRLTRRPGDKTETISLAVYPEVEKEWDNSAAAQDFELISSIAKSARSLISEYGIRAKATIYISVTTSELLSMVKAELQTIETLTFTKETTVHLLDLNAAAPAGCVVSSVNNDIKVFLLVRGMVDIDAEIEKLTSKLEKVQTNLDAVVKKTTIPDYEKRVREDVRELNATKIETLKSEIDSIHTAIAKFDALK